MSEITEETLLQVEDPTSIHPGSIDIDTELFKLAHNLRALAHLKPVAGRKVIQFEYEISKQSAELAISITGEQLTAFEIVKSDKFKLIKYQLADLYRDAELAKIEYRYFCDMWATYHEWVNIYKKTRVLDEGQP